MDYYGYGMYNAMAYTYESIAYVIAVVLAIVLATVLFFTMLRRENEKKFTGAKAKIYHFLNVNKFYAEDIIRFLYVLTVCVLTLLGLARIIMGSFLSGLLVAVVGNIAARISYECMLMFFVLVRKTVSIDKRLSKIEKFYGDDFDSGSSCDPDGIFCDENDEETYEKTNVTDVTDAACTDCSSCDSYSSCEQYTAAGCEAANADVSVNTGADVNTGAAANTKANVDTDTDNDTQDISQ